MSNPITSFLLRPINQRKNAKKLIITSANGICEEQFVMIGGIEQWLTIRGEDRNNPVLLFIHGGPGSPYTVFTPWLRSWERFFTVVQWDQRGAGKTYQKNGEKGSGELSFERLTQDGIEVIEFLLRYLGKQKLILIGSSVGSVTGTIIASRRPDLLNAYVGTDQNSSWDVLAPTTYQLTQDLLRKTDSKKDLQFLEKMGSDPARWTRQQVEQMNKLAIKANTTVPNMVNDLMLPALMSSPSHSLRDIQSIVKGMNFSMDRLYAELISFDIGTIGYQFRLPFFIFQGNNDIITPTAAAKAYFDKIQSPCKEFVLIRHAGHLAAFSNPEQFLQALLAHVRPLALV